MVRIPAKYTGKAAIRRQFKSLTEAKKFAKAQRDGKEVQGKVFFKATDAERGDFSDVIPKLREAGITIREAVEFAIPRLRPPGGDKTLQEVIDEMRRTKKRMLDRGTLRAPTERVFRVRSNQVAEKFGGKLVRDLTLDEVKG